MNPLRRPPPPGGRWALRPRWASVVVGALATAGCSAESADPPSADSEPPWSEAARSAGFDPVGLQAAIDYAEAHETSMPQDPGAYLRDRFEGLPYQDIVGPTQERGGVNGLLFKDGELVVAWGDVDRVDMTFSVTKSYLSTVAGLALDDGLIRDLDDPVAEYVTDGTFAGDHNGAVTWRHLLNQTSEWTGTLWEKPDEADRREGIDREIQAPGTFWEYNDVRVNLLAYALLHVWKRPLPEVLAERVMDPIGASATWAWHGYETSWTDIDGNNVQSVSGGGHWGGGIFISSRDHARFGQLFLNRGSWNGEQLLSETWVDQATAPVAIRPNYGFLWWLNTDRAQFPSAPESSFFALGAGSTSVIWVEPENEIVAVTRWVDGNAHVDEFIRLVLEALA